VNIAGLSAQATSVEIKVAEKKGLSIGIIIGIAVSSAIIICIVIFLIVRMRYKR
jgi:hypothetical protein